MTQGNEAKSQTPTLGQFNKGLLNYKHGNKLVDAINGLQPAADHGQHVGQFTNPNAQLKVTSIVAVGVYGVMVLNDDADPDQAGDLTYEQIGTEPDPGEDDDGDEVSPDDSAILWNVQDVAAGANALAVGDVVGGRVIQHATDGRVIFLRDAGGGIPAPSAKYQVYTPIDDTLVPLWTTLRVQ